MKPSIGPRLLWSLVLALLPQRSSPRGMDTSDLDLCRDEDLYDPRVRTYRRNSSGQMQLGEDDKYEEDGEESEESLSCLYYPTKKLSCFMSPGAAFRRGTRFSASITTCNGKKEISSLKCPPVEIKVAEDDRLSSLVLCQGSFDYEFSHVILHVNMSLPDVWTLHTCRYNLDLLEVLSPPPRMSAFVREGVLNVSWDVPSSRSSTKPYCFEYQLNINDRIGEPFQKNTYYTENNAVPTRAYKMRMRTRITKYCLGSSQWSAWSHVITVDATERPTDPLDNINYFVIASISLGIPMILLALLLLVRIPRVSQLLFPPIPRPPPKYKHFLMRHDALHFQPPSQPPKYVEDITEVEEDERGPGTPCSP